jgi:hypothetical protein
MSKFVEDVTQDDLENFAAFERFPHLSVKQLEEREVTFIV